MSFKYFFHDLKQHILTENSKTKCQKANIKGLLTSLVRSVPWNIGTDRTSEVNKLYIIWLAVIFRVSVTFKKYKTFSVLIYSYINTSGNWKNEKLCGNTTPAGLWKAIWCKIQALKIYQFQQISININHFFIIHSTN